ncbi:hypothetical protein BCV69DRAFT_301013 [Microstroma glucosiphilum]|uniref:CHCH domain-containing protein n=1 Tax=Pseudomicrostroma glucosiphilum TaxID=1684307 RepID=A0A316U0Y1_9BASI|nr:hypothetical protein BCV69DRAFT_301013 [Pseudomicrostroma glucosiphilum]PWN18860.1 hypothetical protein BCV69DRAFT_301013 [Pseudomicrostroma glucosiphilum]
MPRSSRSGGGGGRPSSRPTFGSSSSSSTPAGSRGAHTMAGSAPSQQQSYRSSQPGAATPAHAQAAPQTTSGGGGLFGNMASTAAGVAVGSTVGHGLSNMLFGGRGETAPVEQQQTTEFAQEQANGNRMGGVNCEAASKDFLRCLDATGNNMESCSFYLEQLKQCQAAASRY